MHTHTTPRPPALNDGDPPMTPVSPPWLPTVMRFASAWFVIAAFGVSDLVSIKLLLCAIILLLTAREFDPKPAPPDSAAPEEQ
ncbi:MAG: hypothetical protein KDK24_10160 [Pseudooceanicola sp.]|nr:hypothetical protein [Pseudooceanicola sp.]